MGRFNCCLVAVALLGVGLGTLMEAHGAPTDAGEESAWRSVRQDGRVSLSLNFILSQTGLSASDREKVLEEMGAREGDQLASDLIQLIWALNEPRYAGLREEVSFAISRPMSKEKALDLLTRLNGLFWEEDWWRRMLTLALNRVRSW